MNLTDKEIIKALECCLAKENCEVISCEKCPLENRYECTDIMFHKTLDLINRLQDEKKSLINGQETLQKTIVEQKAEIERLEEMFDSSVSSERNVVDNIGYEKSEAIKEFAERLKKEALKHKIFPLDSCVDFDDIDNLVKELTEQKE